MVLTLAVVSNVQVWDLADRAYLVFLFYVLGDGVGTYIGVGRKNDAIS
jgi:hypothetical protein